MTACPDYDDLVIDYWNGESSLDDLAAHVAECEECQRRVEEERRQLQLPGMEKP